jgi:hypothetical protein
MSAHHSHTLRHTHTTPHSYTLTHSYTHSHTPIHLKWISQSLRVAAHPSFLYFQLSLEEDGTVTIALSCAGMAPVLLPAFVGHLAYASNVCLELMRFSHLILTTILQGRCYYYSQLPDEQTRFVQSERQLGKSELNPRQHVPRAHSLSPYVTWQALWLDWKSHAHSSSCGIRKCVLEWVELNCAVPLLQRCLCGSQLGTFCCQGAFGNFWRHFGLSRGIGVVAIGRQWEEAREGAQQPTMHRTDTMKMTESGNDAEDEKTCHVSFW